MQCDRLQFDRLIERIRLPADGVIARHGLEEMREYSCWGTRSDGEYFQCRHERSTLADGRFTLFFSIQPEFIVHGFPML